MFLLQRPHAPLIKWSTLCFIFWNLTKMDVILKLRPSCQARQSQSWCWTKPHLYFIHGTRLMWNSTYTACVCCMYLQTGCWSHHHAGASGSGISVYSGAHRINTQSGYPVVFLTVFGNYCFSCLGASSGIGIFVILYMSEDQTWCLKMSYPEIIFLFLCFKSIKTFPLYPN